MGWRKKKKEPLNRVEDNRGIAMKNYQKVLWAMIILLGIGLLCWAGEGLLPAEHWAYSAMSHLATEGLLEDLPNIDKGELLTRFEVAYYLKKVLLHLDANKDGVVLTPENDEILDQLILEFRSELKMLGVKITELLELTPSVGAGSEKDLKYSDLDLVIGDPLDKGMETTENSVVVELDEPYYLTGEYFTNDFNEKTFLFLPENHTQPFSNLAVESNRWEIVYGFDGNLEFHFLVFKGNLPLESKTLKGIYLFPLEKNKSFTYHATWDQAAQNLLEQLSAGYKIHNVWQEKGAIPLSNLSRIDNTSGLALFQIGNYLITTDGTEETTPSLLPMPMNNPYFQDLDLLLSQMPNRLGEVELNSKIDLPNQLGWQNPLTKRQQMELENNWSKLKLTESSVQSSRLLWTLSGWDDFTGVYWDDWNDHVAWLMLQMELLSQPESPSIGALHF